ncbi:MAG: hypothetical protein JXA98_01300 [Methanosarcinaceae archaeon]|nr:hypothetical protein [Methanosarcinaceae archaeon]
MNNLGFLLFQTLSSTALLVLIYVFYRLSQHLGEALQMKQYYQLFVIGAIFIVFSMLIQFYILLNMPLNNYQLSQFNSLIISSITLMAIGATFSYAGVFKYWGWLVKEIF